MNEYEDELLEDMAIGDASVPSRWDAALDSQASTQRRQAVTDAKIREMASSLPRTRHIEQTPRIESVSPEENDPRFDARQHPEREITPQDSNTYPRKSSDGLGFDWARALTAFGGGDVGAYDANRRWQAGQGERDLDMQIKRQGMLAKQQDMQEAQRSKRALVDPASPESQEARSMFNDYAIGISNADGIPQKLADQLRAAAQSSGDMSAAQIFKLKANYDSILPNIIKFGESGRKSAHDVEMAELRRDSIAASQANAAAMRGLTSASQAETKRMHDAQIENMNKDNLRADVTIRRAQDKLNSEISNLETAITQMDELSGLANDVNTGPITDFVYNKVGVGKFDELVPQKRKDLEALAARLFNKETKTLAGAAVSDAEWARIAPQIPQSSDDDATFQTKLQRAKEETKRILAARRQEYQLTPSGSPIDTSKTAARSVAADNARSAPNGQRVKQNGKWFVWNGSKYVKE